MNGLGNDFVVIDTRSIPNWRDLSTDAVRRICDRRRGIGCDQLVLIEHPMDASADLAMRLYNADGGETGACGNASRCVALDFMRGANRKDALIETASGLLECEKIGGDKVRVDMGLVKLDWRDIPLREACDTAAIPLNIPGLQNPVGVNVGNPHAVFFVEDADKIDPALQGPAIERHPFFPERTNVEFVSVLSPSRLRMRVWERGAGVTQACGTGACAALVAASRKNLSGRKAEVILDGGVLEIEFLPDDHVLMTGGADIGFSGTWQI